jgi:site-specific DNA-methyltransferase (adenine-specific)
MRWLVRLVCPPGGTVLDWAAGSGTTLLAARDEGMNAIGIEMDQAHARICEHRLGEPFSPSLFSDIA